MRALSTWRGWLRGLTAAVINGFATGITLVIVAPETFNLQAGWRKLLGTSIALGIWGAANYLKQSPLPEIQDAPAAPTNSPESSRTGTP